MTAPSGFSSSATGTVTLRLGARQVRRAVAVEDARAGAGVDRLEARRRRREHRVGEAVRRRLHDRDRLVVGVDDLDAQVRAEHLGVGVAGHVVHAVGQAVHAGGAIRAARQALAGDDRLGPSRLRDRDRGLELRERRAVDERPREHARILGRTERQLARHRAQRVDEPVGDLPVHEHALGAGAALPRAEVRPHADLVDRLAEGRVVEDHAGVLATHLERDEQLGAIERTLEDLAPDVPRAGEAEAAQLRRRDERRADVAHAEHDVEHAGREVRRGRGLGV
ncbi:MAG: hypothetical protein NT062_01090, partial [Proteobacteria bacterium]|nr:hypothetical protein [Pseudomonadota bacterium]